VFGRDNQFVVGASLDHGNVRFNASSELGTIGSDLFITGTGVIPTIRVARSVSGRSTWPASTSPFFIDLTSGFRWRRAL
jgi:hypothetical protein